MTTTRQYPALAFTDSVKRTQERYGTRDSARKLETAGRDDTRLTSRETEFIMDYPNRRRLKIMARAGVFEAIERPDLIEQLEDSSYDARVERAVLYRIVAFDWNCPQHITPRFSEDEILAARTPAA